MEVAFTAIQSAGRSGALNTRRHAFGGYWRGGERDAEVEFESASGEGRSGEPGRELGRMLFSF